MLFYLVAEEGGEFFYNREDPFFEFPVKKKMEQLFKFIKK